MELLYDVAIFELRDVSGKAFDAEVGYKDNLETVHKQICRELDLV